MVSAAFTSFSKFSHFSRLHVESEFDDMCEMNSLTFKG